MNLIKVTGTYNLPYIIKVEWTAYTVFSIIFIPFLVSALVLQDIQAQSLVLVLFLIAIVWLERFKISLTASSIEYQTLLSGKHSIDFSEIDKVEVDIGFSQYSAGWQHYYKSRTQAYYRLNILQNGQKTLTINMKPFSRRDLAIVMDAIYSHNPNIKMDDYSRSLKDGDFKPILMGGIKKMWQVMLFIFSFSLAISLLHLLLK
jgi:hypothetical protein